MVAAAVVAGAAVSAAASAASSSSNSSAIDKAGKQSQKAAGDAQQQLEQGRDQARTDLQPYADTGKLALDQLALQMGLLNTKVPGTAHKGQVSDPVWDALIAKYNPQNVGIGTWSKSPQYQQAVAEYKKIVEDKAKADPNYGALTKTFGAEQYKKDPGYTAMVNDEASFKKDFGYTPMVRTLADLQATPGYQFQLEQGLQSVNNSAAAKGSMLSGANMKAINDYAQGQASTGYQAAWERAQNAYQQAWNRGQQSYQNAFARDTTNKNNTFQRFQSIANNGQQAATQQGNASLAVGEGMAGITQQNGNNQASLTLAQGQNQANMYTGIGNAINSGIGAYSAYRGGGTGGGYSGGNATNFQPEPGYGAMNNFANRQSFGWQG